MPLYDYECNKCGYELLDIQQSMSEEPIKNCPKCKGETLERIVTGGMMSFVKCGSSANKSYKLQDKWEKGIRKTEDGRQITRIELNGNVDMIERSEARIQDYKNKRAERIEKQKEIKEISKMSAEQKHNYIMTGKKP